MSLPVRVVLTAGFVSTGLFCVRWCVGPTASLRWTARVDYGAHSLMSASMIAMTWASSPFASWQIAVFTLAVCWFLLRATGTSLSTAPAAGAGLSRTAGGCPARHPAGAALHCLHHAVVMAAMAWSISVMAAGSPMVHGPGMHGGSSPGTRYVAAAGGGYCLLVAALLAVGTHVKPLTASGHGGIAGELTHALMTAGMAVMLLAML